MAHHHTQAARLASLAQELADARSESSTASAITERAVEFVPDAEAVSITIKARRRRYVTLASSSDFARTIDELQYALDEGPCVAAADGHDWSRSGDVGEDPRWPRWGPAAAARGVGSMLSVRLLSAGSPVGALNMYARSTGRFADRDEVELAVLYSAHVAIALSASRQVSGLETALHSRHVIGFAQGIIGERYGLDMERSFELLRRYSNDMNVKLSVVAEQIVRTRTLPGPRGLQPAASRTTWDDTQPPGP